MPEDATRVRGVSSRYELIRLLGAGGMAHVYLGYDTHTETEVAIKVLRPELAASVSASRFPREIRYMRTMHHPNILPILDWPDGDEAMYFVMPYVAGPTLQSRLAMEGPLPVSEVRRIAAEIAAALDYAHHHNVLHRDLKPANVLLDGERVLVCDFGIARAISLSLSEERLSSSGIVVGTPHYMSPEQAFGSVPLDARADIYALGCVVYEMLAGEPPFAATSGMALIAAHATQPPRPIRSVRPEVPRGLEAAVLAALSKDAHQRPASGTAFVALMDARLTDA